MPPGDRPGVALRRAAAGAVASAVSGPFLVGRFGVRAVLGAVLGGGMVLTVAGFGLLARVPADGSFLADVLPATLLVAVGEGAAFTAFTVGAVAGVKEEEQGAASGLVNTSLQVGAPPWASRSCWRPPRPARRPWPPAGSRTSPRSRPVSGSRSPSAPPPRLRASWPSCG